MKQINQFIICLLWTISLSGYSLAAAAEADFYVATDGNDKWSGKLAAPNDGETDGPFATLERARTALRASGKVGGTVLIRGGDEIRTHDIHVGNVMHVHCNPLRSRNLIFRGSSKHPICTKLFARTGMNWQGVA